ncbi:hypothetical protein APHAL10511_007856 [Amanita phalloides]|nr:hypothetical protein APHAL10511_007856 [Amanita phalloides]
MAYEGVPSTLSYQQTTTIAYHQWWSLSDRMSRINVLKTNSDATIHMLPIDPLLAGIPPGVPNDRHLGALVLPIDSYLVHSAVVIHTPVGTFTPEEAPVVRVASYPDVDSWAFDTYRSQCNDSYSICSKRLVKEGRTPKVNRPTYVERCTHTIWKRVVLAEKHVTYRAPKLEAQ